jgi:hypothetical protein
MSILRGLGETVHIDWDIDTQWDVQFEGEVFESPFRSWIPVTDLEMDLYPMRDFEFGVGGVANLGIPSLMAQGSINCTFLDSKGIMRTWFEKWIKVLHPAVGRVACIGDYGVIRRMKVAELDIGRNQRSVRTFGVRLCEGFGINRGSEGNFQQYKAKFKVHSMTDTVNGLEQRAGLGYIPSSVPLITAGE